MGALLIPMLAILVIRVVPSFGLRDWMAGRRRTTDELARPETPTLDYAVPEGQDPTVVLVALRTEGYSAAPDPGDVHLLHISCPAGPDRDRARVRNTIAGVRTTAIDAGVPMDPGEIRFTDEG